MTYEGYLQKSPKHKPTDSNFYIARQLDKCVMRLNFAVGPERTQMTNTQKMNISEMNAQIFLICMSVLRTRANKKGSTQTKPYRVSILRITANQKALSSIHVIWTIANQKAFI